MRSFRHHAHQDAVAADEVVIERGQRVQAGQAEQRVGQQLMDFFRRTEHAGRRGHAKVQPERPIVEGAPVPDKGDDAEDGMRTIRA